MLLAAPGGAALADARGDAADIGDALEFDGAMLGAAHKGVDLSRFANGMPVEAGVHDVQVVVNGTPVVRRMLAFAYVPGHEQAQPCFDDALLASAGVHERLRTMPGAVECPLLPDLVPGASAHYDIGDFTLHLSIPQAYVDATLLGATDPATWEPGITAARLNYALNTYHAHGRGDAFRTTSLFLDAGINLGTWRFRQRSMHGWNDAGRNSDVQSAYAQTDLPSHGAQVTVGDFQTTGMLFDSIALRGLRMETEDRMLPDSQRGYAPVVQGIAHGNAVVTIRQNGQVIRELNVPAGPFVIRDLYPSGAGGALDVTVTEADGRQEVFIVPYASVPQLLRPGLSRFSLAAGEWRGAGVSSRPMVLQATAQRGINNLVTTYTGLQATDDHATLLAGAAFNTRVGAFALDGTNAWAKLGDDATSGQSWRASYSKFLPATRTSIMVAAHKHNTRDYVALADQVAARDNPLQLLLKRPKNQFELQLSQPLAGGSLHASASLRDYWDRLLPERNAQLGYSWNVGQVGMSLAGRWREGDGGSAGEGYFSMSVPLGSSLHSHRRLTTSGGYARDRRGYGAMALTGSAGADARVSYGVTATHPGAGGAVRTGANLGVQGGRGTAAVAASQGDGQFQWNASADGGLLWHAGGITFGPSLSDTAGLVRAGDAAEGARLFAATGVRVDRKGHALIPSLAPYRRNLVEIDPRGLDMDVQFETTSIETVPRAGAIVALPFTTRRDRSWIVRALRHDGSDVPFGAEIRDLAGTLLGTVGRDGLAFLQGTPASGPLQAQWGATADDRCRITGADLPDTSQSTRGMVPQVDVRCMPSPMEG